MKKLGRNEQCYCGSRIKYKKCCLKTDSINKSLPPNIDNTDIIFIDDKNYEYFGDYKIFRPTNESELRIRKEAELNLKKHFTDGTYDNSQKINEIIKTHFQFFEKKLEQILPEIASYHLIEFLLYQYDISYKINIAENYISLKEKTKWQKIGPIIRRSIKYLIERVILFSPSKEPFNVNSKINQYLDEVWICTELMVELYISSDTTINIYPDHTTLTLSFNNSLNNYFELNSPDSTNIRILIEKDTKNKSQIFGPIKEEYPYCFDSKILDIPMEKSFEISYSNTLTIISTIIMESQPAPDELGILLINKENLINTIISTYKNFTYDQVANSIAGFSLTKENMQKENREIFKPKQEYRAFCRGFFEFTYNDIEHICFSREMAKEAFIQLTSKIVFKHLPNEWLSKDKDIEKALETLSNNAGKWFENIATENLKNLGIYGRSYNKQIGRNNFSISIPNDIGEIDFIGYSPSENMLYILEFKMVWAGTEPAFFKQDLDKFIYKSNGEKSYLAKYKKKVEWVINNKETIIPILNELNEFDITIKPQSIGTAIVTYAPNIASLFIEEYPCTSLTNLVVDFKANNKWPFTYGIFEY